MIGAYAEPALADALRGNLPKPAKVVTGWPEFLAALSEADLAVVAIERPGVTVDEPEIRQLADRGYPPILLVTDPAAGSLRLLAHLSVSGCVALADVPVRLREEAQAALEEDPRPEAARAILGEIRPRPIVEAVVRRVLSDGAPPRSIGELADGLDQTLRVVGDAWRADVGTRTGVPLLQFIRRSRGIWSAAALADEPLGGVAGVAGILDVDASTVYRDLALAGIHTRDLGPLARRKAARNLLADLGVGDGRTWAK